MFLYVYVYVYLLSVCAYGYRCPGTVARKLRSVGLSTATRERRDMSSPAKRPRLPLLRHVVLLKFKDDVDKAEAKAKMEAGLNEMAAKISELKSFACGGDANLDPERNHDFVIIADFADEAAYKAYSVHPAHVEVIGRLIKPVLAAGGRVAVQYQVAGGAL